MNMWFVFHVICSFCLHPICLKQAVIICSIECHLPAWPDFDCETCLCRKSVKYSDYDWDFRDCYAVMHLPINPWFVGLILQTLCSKEASCALLSGFWQIFVLLDSSILTKKTFLSHKNKRKQTNKTKKQKSLIITITICFQFEFQ